MRGVFLAFARSSSVWTESDAQVGALNPWTVHRLPSTVHRPPSTVHRSRRDGGLFGLNEDHAAERCTAGELADVTDMIGLFAMIARVEAGQLVA